MGVVLSILAFYMPYLRLVIVFIDKSNAKDSSDIIVLCMLVTCPNIMFFLVGWRDASELCYNVKHFFCLKRNYALVVKL